MNEFPADISFKYPWRSYQRRVLGELHEHLRDDHLHIIAPPGSGKTILGLEVALRLNQPTLILAPTLAIRDQWIQRFCDLFLQYDQMPGWISKDIKAPAFLTVSTYQAMHAAITSEQKIPSLVSADSRADVHISLPERLREQNIQTLIIDEAHHLKNAWWESLIKIKNSLNPTVVGLTATPPYDVSPGEWQRYERMNGPVDSEISVPELVVEGNLCPHQDYVVFSMPSRSEQHEISEYRRRSERFFQELSTDPQLINILSGHPAFLSPGSYLDWIYSNIECYSSLLIFLNYNSIAVSQAHLEVLGNENLRIPSLTHEWLEIGLQHLLFSGDPSFKPHADFKKQLADRLRRAGILDHKTISFLHNRKLTSSLGRSIGKLRSIQEIALFEYENLGKELRMVILTDFIRKEFLDSGEPELSKIGVIPIFQLLRRSSRAKLGVLTGSIIIIPAVAARVMQTHAQRQGVPEIKTDSLSFDPDYVIVQNDTNIRHHVVHLVTRLFQEGHIEILTGTKSLLGEGWDAPAVNSLLMASFVGSYVLSNQMRGRAIRVQKGNPKKTATIWHLVCIDPTAEDGGDDMALMRRRFRTFTGVSEGKNPQIKNGFSRLNIPDNLTTGQTISSVNERMFANAKQRTELRKNWMTALENGIELTEEIMVPFESGNEGKKSYKQLTTLYFNRTIRFVTAMLASGIFAFSTEVLQIFTRIRWQTYQELMISLSVVGGVGVLLFGRSAFKTLRILLKYRDIAGDIHQIGEALLASLSRFDIIRTKLSLLHVSTQFNEDGSVNCHLAGGTTYEKSTFIKALQETLGVVENPRYVIIRKGHFLQLHSQHDYHAVPEVLGRKKETAEFFANAWRRKVGKCELVYTRNIAGRKLLIRSRFHSLASEFEEKITRINRWKM